MKKILLTTFIISSLNLHSQEVNLSKNQLNVNIIPLGLSYEKGLTENISATISTGLTSVVHVETIDEESNTFLFISPFVTSSLRNYYTRKSVKKSNLRPNSGNYIGLFYSLQFQPFGSSSDPVEASARDNSTNVFTVGPVWGIQRNYASGIHLGLSLGVGYYGGENIDTSISPIGDFTLGFVLFSN